MMRWPKIDLSDVLLAVGMGSLGLGLYLVNVALALIVLGVLFMVLGFLSAWMRASK